MGLFRRDGEGDRSDGEGGRRGRFGHAAFDPADIDDARRGHPAVTLQPFAATVGLDYRDVEQAGAFVATLPTWPDYIFNVCRGPVPGGRYAMVAHELYEVRAHNGSVQAAGAFHDIHLNTRMGRFEIGGIEQGAVKNEPFWGNAVWLPTTAAHVRAPETNRLPVLRVARSSSYAVSGNNGLDGFGLPGFRWLGPDLDPDAVASIAGVCRPGLTSRPDAHVELRVRFGVVALTVNGYRADEQDLRSLLSTADGLAAALTGLLAPAVAQPFETPGPAAGAVPVPAGTPAPDPDMVPQYGQQAAQWGMVHEDPSHLVSLLPRCPIPGRPSGVLLGRLPGGAAVVRVVWFDQGGRTAGSVRGGVIVPAAPGAATPIGGQLHPQTGMYAEVVDGTAYCWRQTRSFGTLEADDLVVAAKATLGATGLAVV
jgi:hypothetical protein